MDTVKAASAIAETWNQAANLRWKDFRPPLFAPIVKSDCKVRCQNTTSSPVRVSIISRRRTLCQETLRIRRKIGQLDFLSGLQASLGSRSVRRGFELALLGDEDIILEKILLGFDLLSDRRFRYGFLCLICQRRTEFQIHPGKNIRTQHDRKRSAARRIRNTIFSH